MGNLNEWGAAGDVTLGLEAKRHAPKTHEKQPRMGLAPIARGCAQTHARPGFRPMARYPGWWRFNVITIADWWRCNLFPTAGWWRFNVITTADWWRFNVIITAAWWPLAAGSG